MGGGVRKVHYGLCEHGKFITLQISFCIVRLPYFVTFITFTFFYLFTLEMGAVHLCFVTEIAPPQQFLCVNRSPIRYDIRGGAKAI